MERAQYQVTICQYYYYIIIYYLLIFMLIIGMKTLFHAIAVALQICNGKIRTTVYFILLRFIFKPDMYRDVIVWQM